MVAEIDSEVVVDTDHQESRLDYCTKDFRTLVQESVVDHCKPVLKCRFMKFSNFKYQKNSSETLFALSLVGLQKLSENRTFT